MVVCLFEFLSVSKYVEARQAPGPDTIPAFPTGVITCIYLFWPNKVSNYQNQFYKLFSVSSINLFLRLVFSSFGGMTLGSRLTLASYNFYVITKCNFFVLFFIQLYHAPNVARILPKQ